MVWLTDDDQAELIRRNRAGFPIPTRVIGNGEYTPPPMTDAQRRLEGRLSTDADELSREAGMDRRGFLHSGLGMSAAFLGLNAVYGTVFDVARAEAVDPGAHAEWRRRVQDQFVFDGHLHFVHDSYAVPQIVGLRFAAKQIGAEGLPDRRPTLEDLKFENFVKEVYFDSDTAVGIVSSATSDHPEQVFLTNGQIAESVSRFNDLAGSRRLYGHGIFEPGKEGWLEAIDETIELYKPVSWKGYTIGDPLGPSGYAWRMDDEDLVYPAYERFQKAGINTVCVHKGLLPQSYEQRLPGTWRHAMVDDVGKAAKDWPGLNFVIYHAALKPAIMFDDATLARFEETGEIDWVSDLARIREEWGVDNVYADVGTSFGSAAITYPRLAAGLMASLVHGLGEERVLWGTDAVWYGSPQWQIEAFRRIELPEELQEKFGWPALGAADGTLKSRILGGNSAKLYGLSGEQLLPASKRADRLARIRGEAPTDSRSNAYYGFIHKGDAG
jgi:predicted TIM-barrel fold metal-dependent hydrolase